MKLKPISSLNHLLQVTYSPPPQTPIRLKENIADLPFNLSSVFFHPGRFFLCLSTGCHNNFRFLDFWGMKQWENSLSYRHHFRKATREAISFAPNLSIVSYFLRWQTKKYCSDYVAFHWLLIFSEKEDFVQCTYKKSSWKNFKLKARTDFILNHASFVS